MHTDLQRPQTALARPGLVGLAARALLGVASMQGLVAVLTQWPAFREQSLTDFWLVNLVTICVLPEVFTITFRRRWGGWPRLVYLGGGAVIGLSGYAATGELWTTALAAWVYAADLLVMGTLAVSFALATVTRSPGCELDALPSS